jgi:hypothetical protein
MDQLRDVSNILWRERNLLELLAFKLESERLLARAGRTQWLARADHEVEVVLGALKAVELERGIHVQALAVGFELETEPTLQALAERAPVEWAGIFADHRRALLELARDVDRSARRSRRRLDPVTIDATAAEDDERGAVAVSRAVADIVTPARGQAATDEIESSGHAPGRGSRATPRPDAVVARIPSLVDFLR